ncbi:MAG: SBBP repeat-containing protein [Phycisphaerae bacterium]|nr:SBBP repeat-containing protein [Phycisphaerae bacterium]
MLAVLSSDGSKLVYATFLGGSGDDLIRSVAIDPNGDVYLVGSTSSRDFPVTSNAVQTRLAGSADAFVVKLVPAG